MAADPADRRSAVAPLANRRGGPGNYVGVGFQTRVGVWSALGWLREAIDNPAAAEVLRCEPRTLVRDGQVAFDVGRTSATRRQMYEVKSNPRKNDVVEFVRHAVIVDGLTEARPGVTFSLTLVSETVTAWFTALERLWILGQEAADAAELVELVGRHGDDRMSELLGHLGAAPMSVLGVISKPTVMPEQVLESMSLHLSSYICEAGQSEVLRKQLTDMINDGSRDRLSMPLSKLVARLSADGVLAAPRGVDTSTADPRLVTAISVLQESVVPLPGTVLASGVEVTEDELAEVMAEHLEQGGVQQDEAGRYYCPPVGTIRLRSDADANARTLQKLIDEAGQQKEHYAHQAPNALALAEACIPARPDAVTHVFVAFDKAAKAWGDLHLTYRLAQVATQAIVDVLGGCEDSRQEMALVQDKIHTKVCGQSWVLQRVGELEDSHRELSEANALTSEYHDPANHAFGLKCEGRIMRMRAEELPVEHPDRAELLTESERMLRAAFVAFDDLLASAPHFYEDHGECLSLLARTLATAQRFEEAYEEIRRAETILEARLASKAFADLVILKGDIRLAQRSYDGLGTLDDEDDDDEVALVRGLLTGVDALIKCHDAIVTERFTPSSSEIAARARVLAGRLHESLGDVDASADRYREAADLYKHLRYPGAHDEALWRAEVVSEQAMPEGLRRAFDEEGASATVRLIALERWRQQAPQGGPGAQDAPNVDSPVWVGFVREAARKGMARKTKWGEGRTA